MLNAASAAGSEAPPPVVTLSASYGAAGSQIGPRVAARLGVPFLDRAIPTGVAQRLAVPLNAAIARDESGPRRLERLLWTFASMASMAGGDTLADLGERSFPQATEQVIRAHARTGGVILGRAAALVLRDHPGALHVRLTGPRERRVAHAMQLEQLDRRAAARRVTENDSAREAYVRFFYDVDANDPTLYHLVLDSTAIRHEACVALIVGAARARRAMRSAAV